MTPTDDDAVATEELLAAYADDPRALSVAERARVEAWLAAAGDDGALAGLRATVAEVRGLPTDGTAPAWPVLEARIFAATTRSPRARWPWLAGGAAALALAAAIALWVRPGGHAPLPFVAIAVPPPAPAPVSPDEVAPTTPDDDVATIDDDDDDDHDDDDASDLDGLGAIDDALVDEVIALDAADDDRGDDDLPAIGATWTGWLDDFSDAELDRALAWLDTEEAG